MKENQYERLTSYLLTLYTVEIEVTVSMKEDGVEEVKMEVEVDPWWTEPSSPRGM